MELGIKGHKTRNNEVIDLLKMLGGINRNKVIGGDDKYFYYICDKYKDISNSYIGPDEIKGYEIFSLEDFLEKFPYKVGDKVNVWKYRLEGRSELEEGEIKSMRWNSARCEVAYRFKDITGEFYKNDIRGKVDDGSNKQSECEQCGRVFGSVKCFDVDCPNNTPNYSEIDKQCFDEVNKRYSDITNVCLTGRGYTLPDGYHFADENGNVIDAKKILLVKNAPTYPKTYKECCDILGIDTMDNDAKGYKHFLLIQFQELIIARDAYWKIAGEEMGLGKPWEPNNDSETYHIYRIKNTMFPDGHGWAGNCHILEFPTEEMRDAFYENFKDLIEQCKELL